MEQLSKEELEKRMENLTPKEKLDFLKNINKLVGEMNEAIEDYMEKTK